MHCSFVTVLVMDKNQTAKDSFETLGDAARRLLAGLERADKVAGNQSPDKIHEIGRCPLTDKAGEVAAVSAYLIGRRGLGNDKAVVVFANDNDAGWTSGEYDHRASPTRLYPDENAMPKIARIVTLREFGEW